MKLYKRTWAETDLDALASNYRHCRELLPQNTDVMCVVKAFCYGHSDRAAVPFLQNELGVKWFAVSNLDEALRLRKLGITGEILILGYTAPEEADELIGNNIIQTLVSLDYAEELSSRVIGNGIGRVRCHAAVDTGMTRIGLRGTAESIADELCRISRLGGLSLEGAFTHFAVADTLTPDCIEYTEKQNALLFAAADIVKSRGIKLDKVHTLNSAAALFHYDSRSELARLGIILYGLKPDVSLELPFEPAPVMTLRSTVSCVKTIEPGTSVSYGRTFTATTEMRIATIACGYADGYPRALSNIGEILVHGKRCRIVGRVCMDQFMADVTGIDVKEGDTVTLIGEENGERITADDLAVLTGTIGYEIVCSVSERVPRAAVKDGEVVGIYKL